MVFEVKNKIAIVTGGASGIGFSLSKEILKNGAKGVTIADIDEDNGKKMVRNLEDEFGEHTAIFVQTDVSKYDQFENAFKETIKVFGTLDILINNAGLFRDKLWDKEVAINVNGTLNGILLAFEKYMSNSKQSSDTIVVNISSINALQPTNHIPIYSGTKCAILGFTRSWGTPEIFDKTHVRIVAVCPGATETAATLNGDSETETLTLGPMYLEFLKRKRWDNSFSRQSSEFVAQETLRILKYAPNGTVWVTENSEPAYQYIFPDRRTMKNNVLVEV